VRAVLGARFEPDVVGGDQRQAERIGKVDQRAFGFRLDDLAVAMEFDVKPVVEHGRELL
jgi:hypothetical protein